MCDEHGMQKDSLSPSPENNTKHVLDAENTDDNPNSNQDGKWLTNSQIKVSWASMKAHLHNLVHDKIVPEHRVFRVGRHLHKVDIDYWEAHSIASRHSPRDHLSSSEQPAKHGTKKKRIQRVQPEPTMVTDTPLKTMDGNPLGQNKGVSPDDQDGSRTDYI
jgi:hypothetical protein